MKSKLLHTLMVVFLFMCIIVAGSDGEYFPIPNIIGALTALITVTILNHTAGGKK